jgi:hypothetical protein
VRSNHLYLEMGTVLMLDWFIVMRRLCGSMISSDTRESIRGTSHSRVLGTSLLFSAIEQRTDIDDSVAGKVLLEETPWLDIAREESAKEV